MSIIDIADPAKPKIVVNLPLMNTITRPPVNLAITPDQHLALVANSLDWVKEGDAWKGVPDNKIYVIDLTTSPPQQIGTVEAGKQASGMAINHAGTLATSAVRAEGRKKRPGSAKLTTPSRQTFSAGAGRGNSRASCRNPSALTSGTIKEALRSPPLGNICRKGPWKNHQLREHIGK